MIQLHNIHYINIYMSSYLLYIVGLKRVIKRQTVCDLRGIIWKDNRLMLADPAQ